MKSVLHGYCSMLMRSDVDENIPRFPGVYTRTQELAPVYSQFTDALSHRSFIIVGPFRLVDPEYSTRLSILDSVSLIVGKTTAGDLSIDFQFDFIHEVVEDLEEGTGVDDYGADALANTKPEVNAFTSVDGEAIQMLPVDWKIEQEHTEDARIDYVSDATGLYHLLKIGSEETPGLFSLKKLELTLQQGGLL